MMKKSETAWWQPGMALFLKLSGWIGGPVIVAVFVGKYLDGKFRSEPWLFLSSVAVAFMVSMAALIHIARKEMTKINKENKK